MKATRQAFGEALARLGETRPEIVVLDADLSKSTKSEIFAKKFPHRFFEMGIAEANMIGTAAGLAFTGKIPFLCSFGCFLTGRYDTIRLSVAYAQANVRLVGTHAGVGIGDDGHSQMGLEDIALMRALPTMGVFQPMDAFTTEKMMSYLVNSWQGPAYLRLTRQNLPNLFPETESFVPLKLHCIRTTKNPTVVLLASGATGVEAVTAQKSLEEKGIHAEVWDAHCLKPFDVQTASHLAQKVKWIVTVEDHSVIGGLGSCMEEVLARLGSGTRLLKLGVQDLFGQSGEPKELYDLYGISAEQITKQTLKFIKNEM